MSYQRVRPEIVTNGVVEHLIPNTDRHQLIDLLPEIPTI
jgi:hypothetical protein